jgi:signal transduction histidine kinase
MLTDLDQGSAPLIAEHNEDAGSPPETAASSLVPAPELVAPSAATKASRNFAEVLRHELNNPLTGILGNAELLLGDLCRQNVDLPVSAKQRIETIAALAVRMRECVRALSDRWEAEATQNQEASDSAALPSLFH